MLYNKEKRTIHGYLIFFGLVTEIQSYRAVSSMSKIGRGPGFLSYLNRIIKGQASRWQHMSDKARVTMTASTEYNTHK